MLRGQQQQQQQFSEEALLRQLPDEIGSLPPFANEKNRALDREIRQKEQRLARLASTVQDQSERADAMQQHMKNVSQEIHYTQALVEARNRELETERHFKMLAERESGRLKQDLIRMQKSVNDISDQMNATQNTIYTDAERVEKLRNDLKIGKEELEEWLRVQQEKEEDSQALEKYAKEDEHKMRELSLHIQKMVADVHKKKNQLSQEMTETQISQMELERTAENFRRLHDERQNLLQQWETAIQTMKKRDEEVEERQQYYQQLRDEVREKQALVDERERQLEEQNEANEHAEKQVLALERMLSKYKSDQVASKTELNNFQEELEMLKKTLHKTSQEIATNQSEIANLNADLDLTKAKLQEETDRRAQAERRLEAMRNGTTTLEQKNAQLVELVRQDEAKSKELDREIKAVREIRRIGAEVKALKATEKSLAIDIVSTQKALKNLKSKASSLELEAMKQQGFLYSQSFIVQQLESKVRRAQGERSSEEKEALELKIKELTQKSEDWKRKLTILKTQFKKGQEDVKQANHLLTTLQKEKAAVNEQIAELNLHNDSATSQLSGKIKEKEELLVEENILRLELRKLRSFLNARADNVLSLENRQAQLQLALEERSKEIEIHKEMFRAHIKTAEEERYSANAELRDRMNKIAKLKRKYEIIMTQLPADEDNVDRSQAYYIIKAAQDKDELQREGDALDAKIKTKEKEVRALENTLYLMNNRNESFRQTIQRYEADQGELEQKEQLEKQFNDAMVKYKGKRRQIEELQEQLHHLEQALAALAEDESSKMHEVADMEDRLQKLHAELADQKVKSARAHKHCMKLAKEWRAASGVELDVQTPEEVDFDIKEAKDFNRMLMTKLSEVAEQHPEIEQKFGQMCADNGIPALSRPPTSRSVLSSRQSGRYSRASTSSRAGVLSRQSELSRRSTPGVGVLKVQQFDGSSL